jgi:DNA-directed RNA polymerase subunit RPC12/RpoP
MPYSIQISYICPICGKSFLSTHYKRPERCPICRRSHRSKQALINYYKRKEQGRAYDKRRESGYDNIRCGAPESVYAPTCSIHLKREYAACQCCGTVTDIINGYCDVCRCCGANEAQCINAERIR